MFRGRRFLYLTVRVQSTARPSKPNAILLRRRKMFPAISPSLVLVAGVIIAGIAVMTIGLLG
jgi:hypothetical protein